MKELQECMQRRRVFYTTVLSHLISNDGKHLLVSTKDGKLLSFHIENILRSNFLQFDDDDEYLINDHVLKSRKASQVIKTSGPIFSIKSIEDNIFVTGGKGQMTGWQLDGTQMETRWSLALPQNDIMVNSMASSSDLILSGCGDNHIYGYDLQSHKPVVDLAEHEDYINCLCVSEDKNMLYSASEDGSVRIWDLRTKKSVESIFPFKESLLSRPAFGKWLGSLALNGKDWLLCGGGPALSLWHLKYLSSSTKFEATRSDFTPNVAEFRGSFIIAGGNSNFVYVWEMNGDLKAQINSSASNIYSIATHEYNDNEMPVSHVMSSAGTSYKIDICTNWKYKDFELLLI